MESYNDILEKVDISSEEIEKIIKAIVDKHCFNLTKLVNQIKNIMTTSDDDLTDSEIDDLLIQLPLALYEVSDEQEYLGIKDDISTALTKELYNKVYQSSEGKVAEKTATAELATQKQSIISAAISRSYRIVKSKVEAAYELLNGIKKIQNRRIAYKEMRGE